ncbi:MAG: beta-ketoacyl-ACP synthase II [Verrucomicrobia bacterium]|nr:beta-ketoacyl-ACP synthase II [Verrucomicrobiota bacterium]
MERRVVVTGLGVVTSMGHDVATLWQNLKAGRSGVRQITTFDPSPIRCRIGAEVLDFEGEKWFNNHRDAKRADRFIQFAMAASKMAVAQAGIDCAAHDPRRIGVYMGSGIGGLQAIETNHLVALQEGYNKVSAFGIPMMIGNAAGGLVAMDLGVTGPNFCIVSACATGSHNIGEAWRTIKFGDADVMVAGGSESPMTLLAMSGFAKMRALSLRNEEPERASRPYDKDRDGFVMGEGAGVVVLEEYEFARRRGAEILCELAGYGATADAFHPTLPHPEGRGASECMDLAMRHAAVNPEEVGYINAHGTSTPPGDIVETRAIKRSFGAYAKDGLQVSSTKSMTGHLLGAAGGVELAATVMALREGILPPTINLDTPDPECDLDYIPHTARESRIKVALSNSFGFGGNNASLVLRAL